MDPVRTETFFSDTREHATANLPALVAVLAWSRDEPRRIGEICFLPGPATFPELRLGRLGHQPGESVLRGEFFRQRPGVNQPTGPLGSPHISREQLVFLWSAGRLTVRNVGRCDMEVDGQAGVEAPVAVGSVIELRGAAVLYVTERPAGLPPPQKEAQVPTMPFGEADPFGFVGESPAAWALRERVAFVAPRSAHVLVRGPSGAGKELVSTALHALSDHASGPLVSRNAATIPESLVDAELFGNARNYPNPGMAERPGLIGEADGGTLFLDEFAELPHTVQAHLLRVLDGGEYQRLGESRSRKSRFRLVAATNRPDTALKHDVLARLQVRIEVPGLDQRREDVPLLARALLRRLARKDPALAEHWFEGDNPRLAAPLVAALLRRPWNTHVRELEAVLWESMLHSHGDRLELPPDTTPAAKPAATDPRRLTREDIVGALERHGGNQSAAWRALGLSSRFVLLRLMKRHGIPGAKDEE